MGSVYCSCIVRHFTHINHMPDYKKESALSTCAGDNCDKSETERESLLPCFRFHPRFDPSNEK